MPRELTVGEFTAEALEQEAAGMPDSRKEEAQILRNMAKLMRENGSKKIVRVWEQDEGDNRRGK
jgi:hypothetical protein